MRRRRRAVSRRIALGKSRGRGYLRGPEPGNDAHRGAPSHIARRQLPKACAVFLRRCIDVCAAMWRLRSFRYPFFSGLSYRGRYSDADFENDGQGVPSSDVGLIRISILAIPAWQSVDSGDYPLIVCRFSGGYRIACHAHHSAHGAPTLRRFLSAAI